MAQNIIFRTSRLTARPFVADDIAVLADFGVEEVASMMTSLTVPWPEAAIRDWIAEAVFACTPGFRAGVYDGDTLVGFVGIGGDPVNVAYAIHPDMQGRGYGCEAMMGLLAWAFGPGGVREIHADHYADNAGSGHILRKCGFEETHRGMAASAARLEPAPAVFYRLSAQRFADHTQKVTS